MTAEPVSLSYRDTIIVIIYNTTIDTGLKFAHQNWTLTAEKQTRRGARVMYVWYERNIIIHVSEYIIIIYYESYLR